MNADVLRPRIVYWHRELPPVDAEVLGEGEIEATSSRTVAAIPQCDALWRGERYAELMSQARLRLEQEVRRLKGRYAHVLSESVRTRRNDATGEAWLQGAFSYVLLGGPGCQRSRGHECPDGTCQRGQSKNRC